MTDPARLFPSLVIPVYNERPYIEEILRRVQEIDVPKEIITVDDGLTEGTRDWLLQMAQR